MSDTLIKLRKKKEDIKNIWRDKNGVLHKGVGKLDYVSCWYKKAADFIDGKKIHAAFVSTNSICQGEAISLVWKPLFGKRFHIDFAYRHFKWFSESSNMAHVHCVIIGFSRVKSDKPKIIFDGAEKIIAKNINAYLLDAENIFIESRSKPICNVPELITGNRPADGGNLIIEADDYKDFIRREPKAKKFIKQLVGAEEFINGKERYCLWLVDCPPNELRKMSLVMKRVKVCREDRLKGAPDRQKLADAPMLFRETLNPEKYILIPRVSSERRKYIPIGFLNSETIPTDSTQIIPDATIYHFGILTSSVHMAWVRVVAGRLRADYRYSKDIVYNNFVWCEPSESQRKKIEQTAQNILDVRAKYPGASLADLYDATAMPPDLRKAHAENDKAVMSAYGFDKNLSESEIVAELMKLYKKFTGKPE